MKPDSQTPPRMKYSAHRAPSHQACLTQRLQSCGPPVKALLHAHLVSTNMRGLSYATMQRAWQEVLLRLVGKAASDDDDSLHMRSSVYAC
mmetsp:Transcript_27001/g.80057  ORF Transcript_27001/g.80057 Transcript_27001/m.80057 type:complete len:90 (-) Transcript_27001:312-581(-)